jgi:hypothetical protein
MRFHLSACALAITTLLAGCDVPGGGITVEQTDTGLIIEITCPGLDGADDTDGGEETPDEGPDEETPNLDPGTDEAVDGEIPAAIDG